MSKFDDVHRTHDSRIQQAIYSIISADELSGTRLKLARVLNTLYEQRDNDTTGDETAQEDSNVFVRPHTVALIDR